jgi:exodeoxyribonuclease V beta subunit
MMKALQIFEAPLQGLSLVEAGAGTGKTYNITSLYIRAIVEHELVPKQILVLTYTDAATIELKSRIRKRIKDSLESLRSNKAKDDDPFLVQLLERKQPNWIDLLTTALQAFDEASIFTIHGFCQKLLREESISFGVQPDFEVLKDPLELYQDAIDDYWREVVQQYSSDRKGRALLNFLIQQKLSVDELSQFVLPILSKPYAIIEPQNIEQNKIDQVIENLFGLYHQLRAEWHNDRALLQDILNSGVLNGSVYRENVRTTGLKKINNWLEGENEIFCVPEKLNLFTSSVLYERVKKGKSVDPPPFSFILDEFMQQYEQFLSYKEWFILNALNEIKVKITAYKKAINVLSFDDFLQLVDLNLDKRLSTKLAQKYPIALVDEFQDTDPIQYSIFKKIYMNSKSALFMIGDPKQAIYSFRGADLFTYFEATKEVPDEQKYSLSANFRSDEHLIKGVNKLFSVQKHPFILENPAFRKANFPDSKTSLTLKKGTETQASTQFIEIDYDEDRDGNSIGDARGRVSNYVAHQISDLLSGTYQIGNRPVQASDIAVLVKKNAEAELVHQSLYDLGIPSLLKSKESIYSSQEAIELKDILKAILNSSNDGIVKVALSTEYIGYKANQISNLNDDPEALGELVNWFKSARETWSKKGIIAALELLNTEFHIEEKLSVLSFAERRLTNYYHLQELLINIEKQHKSSPSNLYRIYLNKLNNVREITDDELLRLESDDDLVTITTMHSSKGLEYPIVVLPFLWDDMLYSSNKNKVSQYHNDEDDLVINIGSVSEDAKEQQKLESIADAMRLAYVALTRAEVVNIIPLVDMNMYKSTLAALLFGAEAYSSKKDPAFNYEACLSKLNELKDPATLVIKKEEELVLKEHVQKTSFSTSDLSAESFTRNDLDRLTKVVSFSSLSQHSKTDSDGFDFDFDERASIHETQEDQQIDRFSFPRGADAGNLLHDIFEYINFDDSSTDINQVIKEKMGEWGFANKWESLLQEWVGEILTTYLNDELQLTNVSREDVLKEMEFHFTINELDPSELANTIREQNQLPLHTQSVIRGYMKGFIDLIFRHNGKYFILDYKSNHLGDTYDDYKPEHLKTAMEHSDYDIQYHIYVLALKKYLEARDPNFDYERDFGGVYYLFLRGMRPDKRLNGIYFDVPNASKIQRLDEICNRVHQ